MGFNSAFKGLRQWHFVLQVKFPNLLSDDNQTYTYFCVCANSATLEALGKSLHWRRYLVLHVKCPQLVTNSTQVTAFVVYAKKVWRMMFQENPDYGSLRTDEKVHVLQIKFCKLSAGRNQTFNDCSAFTKGAAFEVS
jgi:hypothetical protein